MTRPLAPRELLSNFVLAETAVPPAGMKAFLEVFRPCALRRGVFFVRHGIVELQLGFLLKGALRAFFTTEAGVEYTQKFLLPGALVASPISLFLRQPSTVSMVAMEPSELLVADGGAVEQLYERYPALANFARKMTERAYADREQKEFELAVLSAKERYQRFLERFPTLEPTLSAHEVASYLGVTTTQLGRLRRLTRMTPVSSAVER